MVHSSVKVGRVVEVTTGGNVLYKSGERAALQIHKLYLHTGPPQDVHMSGGHVL
jgi:hypothetical protein